MQLPKVNKIAAIIFLVIGLIGFLDASYLTIEHLRGVSPVCRVVTGCNQVLTSKYSAIGKIPLALLGSIYYLSIIIGSILYLDTKIDKILKIISGFTVAGLLASLYFVYLQIFEIKALCFYCLISAATSTFLFINGMFVLKKPHYN